MDLKSYFHQKYQGGESFIENVILPIFGENKYEDAYEEDVIENNPDLETMAKSTGISNILRLGTIQIPMNPTDVFDITVDNHVQMERNRVTIQALIRRIMSTYSSAFMIFHYNDTDKWDWRFSFCSKLGNNKETTDSKRYTFLLGPNQSCRTAAENFNKLAAKAGNIELEDIVSAFDVETLSKEFFDKYKKHYETFCDFVYENKDNREFFGEEFSQWEDKTIRDYVKKLLGRIVFLHFLQKKGWLGVPADKEWGDGETDFMRKLFDNASQQQKDNYLDEVLEPLFEYGLDTDRTDKNDLFDTGVEGFRNVKIPYLNGGLFDRDVLEEPKSRFPKELFDDLLRFFSEYNFTIDENDPNDAQVGVDPEMLGRIFENLLEDNKDKGAFYTPKEIVQYMCRESLIAYLQTDVKDEESKEAIRKFVTTYDVNAIGGKDSYTAKEINEHLKQVKICDPAIGSGAFPMGVLKELFFCRGAIETFDDAAEIKRHIIQQNIYGVDIEKGAVDIARLRFWLALIVDEKTPHALPNMDFKIMQGNSLLEQYKGVDLSKIMESKISKSGPVQLSFLEEDVEKLRHQLIVLRKEYFNTFDKQQKQSLRVSMRNIVQLQIDATVNKFTGQTDKKNNERIKMDDIDIAATSEFFLWHTWFTDVFENGGFDIVIGNPPYIRPHRLADELKVILWNKYKVAQQKTDVYAFFVELGCKLLAKNGILSYIIPKTWFAIYSFKKLRKLLLGHYDVFQIGLLPDKVFDNATVETALLFVQNDKLHNEINFFDVATKTLKKKQTYESILRDSDLTISIGDNTLAKTATPLGNISKIICGIVSGDDKKYCRFEQKDRLDKKAIRGANISRYFISYTGEYIWYNREQMIIDGNNKPKSSLKAAVGQCSPKKPEDFELPEKIVLQRISKNIIASLDTQQYYAHSSVIIIKPNDSVSLRYILGILNSKYINYWLKSNTSNISINAGTVKKIPIEIGSKDIQNKIIHLVNQILSAKKENPQADTTSLEHEIDLLVYDLYGLTKEERLIVDPDYKE